MSFTDDQIEELEEIMARFKGQHLNSGYVIKARDVISLLARIRAAECVCNSLNSFKVQADFFKSKCGCLAMTFGALEAWRKSAGRGDD